MFIIFPASDIRFQPKKFANRGRSCEWHMGYFLHLPLFWFQPLWWKLGEGEHERDKKQSYIMSIVLVVPFWLFRLPGQMLLCPNLGSLAECMCKLSRGDWRHLHCYDSLVGRSAPASPHLFTADIKGSTEQLPVAAFLCPGCQPSCVGCEQASWGQAASCGVPLAHSEGSQASWP